MREIFGSFLYNQSIYWLGLVGLISRLTMLQPRTSLRNLKMREKSNSFLYNKSIYCLRSYCTSHMCAGSFLYNKSSFLYNKSIYCLGLYCTSHVCAGSVLDNKSIYCLGPYCTSHVSHNSDKVLPWVGDLKSRTSDH